MFRRRHTRRLSLGIHNGAGKSLQQSRTDTIGAVLTRSGWVLQRSKNHL
jgi:hypothetical protein